MVNAFVRRAQAVAAGVAIAGSAGAALACPACAANPGGGAGRYVLIGLMIISPYVASTLVIRFIRKGEALEASAEGRPR